MGDWMILVEPTVVLISIWFKIAVSIWFVYAATHFIVKFW